MEDKHIIIDEALAEHEIVLSSGAQRDLRTAGVWGILLSVFGFIYAAMIVFSGISILVLFQTSGDLMPDGQQGMMNGMAVFMMVIGLLFIIPIVFLLRFSINGLRANSSMKTYSLGETISHLKLSFMTFGIIILLSILLYLIWAVYVATTSSRF